MKQSDLPRLLAELTIEEKASLVSGSGFWHTRGIDRLGIPSIMVSDGPHGLRKQVGEGDQVGADASLPATCFPTASALGSSWDVELVRRVGVAIGIEARSQDLAVVLGPGINIKRSPLCGRNFEYLSEDPHLSGELGAAMVSGIQSQGVGTSLKHFAVNNQETDRLKVSANVDERALRETYLAGFERVVKEALPWTVMCSYNRINGVYASQDPWLLTEVLRDEWGFDGLVMSDWGAVDDPVAAVAAGLDLEMPSSHGAGAAKIVAAIGKGQLAVEVLDTAIGRLVCLLERALPGVDSDDRVDEDAHHALAQEFAADCVVLLKNEDSILPLECDGSRIAVIGEFARTPRYQGAGSSRVNPTRIDNALDALRKRLGDDIPLDFAPGFGVDDAEVDGAALLTGAVEVAAGAATVIVFLGLPPGAESEGLDRQHIDLPVEQIAVLDAVAAVNDRVIVVLANGAVVATDSWQGNANAIVEGWLGGQACGTAIADVLMGATNPSGRLAETMPIRLADTPAFLNFPGQDHEVNYGEGIFVGYRHYDAVDIPVSFPFGHGLSYTTFEYSNLDVAMVDQADAENNWQGAPRVSVSLTVTNVGERSGKEVVQLYLNSLDLPMPRPVRELRGFTKLHLDPGESGLVSFVLTERDLSHWSTRAHGWILEPGTFGIEIGASSRDIRLASTFVVDGPRPELPLQYDSTLEEWLDHPVGHDLLVKALRDAPGGDFSSLIADAEQVRMVASFPMARLITMMGGALSERMIDDLLSELGAGN